MKSVSLNAFTRELRKRTGVKKVRANGRVPAVMYGRHNKPENLELVAFDLEKVVHGSASDIVLLDLSIQGASGNRTALIKDIQHHPLTGKPLHVDLQEVAENEKVTVSVPVETTGEPVGVKIGGGVLEHVLFKIKVRATPKDLPEVIVVDVSNLDVGKSIHLGDIQPPEGVEILGHKEVSVVSVAAPLVEAAAATDAAAAPAGTQPEMLKEKKDEKAGAAKAGDAKAGDKKPTAKK